LPELGFTNVEGGPRIVLEGHLRVNLDGLAVVVKAFDVVRGVVVIA
jgi:ethanolamine utilization protein EutQ (cupin superfamily)